MSDSLSIDEMQATFTRVKRYREVCEHVRNSASNTIWNGIILLGLCFFISRMIGGVTTGLMVMIGIGLFEVLLGLWNKWKPSPEGVLMEGLLLLGWVISVVIREWARIQFVAGGGRASTTTIMLGLMCAWYTWSAFSIIRTYFSLRNYFVERPTQAHLAYVDSLTEEILDATPTTDQTAVHVPTQPELKLKLLGPMVFVLEVGKHELSLVAKHELNLDTAGEHTRLTIRGEVFPPCLVDAASLRNYTAWKASQS